MWVWGGPGSGAGQPAGAAAEPGLLQEGPADDIRGWLGRWLGR